MNRRDFFLDVLLADLLNALNTPTKQFIISTVNQTSEQQNNTQYPYLFYRLGTEKYSYYGDNMSATDKCVTQFVVEIDYKGVQDIQSSGQNRQAMDAAMALIYNAINNGNWEPNTSSTDTTVDETWVIEQVRMETATPITDYGDPSVFQQMTGSIIWGGGND